MKTLALLVPILLAGACATDGGSSMPGPSPQQHMPATGNPSFTLYVSNQSFDRSLVDIHVYIDNRLAVSGDFDVGTQHTWHEFKFALRPGEHAIRVESEDTTVTANANVTINAPKYGVVMYWYDQTQQPEQFDFWSSSERPLFD